MRHVHRDDPVALLDGELHQVAVMRAEGALAVDDHQGFGVLDALADLVHVADLPFDTGFCR